MSETSESFDELETVVRREMRSTLEAFDEGVALMELHRNRLRVLFDDFVANVELAVSEGTPQSEGNK